MKQSEFDALWCAEAIRFSGGQFPLAIESLDNACRDGAQGEEPVDDQRPVPPRTLNDFLHWSKPAAQRLSARRLEELARPCRAGISPEPLQLLEEKMGPDALEVVLQEVSEFGGLVVGEGLAPLEQAPAGPSEGSLVAIPAQLSELLPQHLVDRHVHVPHDVEAVEYVQGLRNLLRDHVDVRLPHIAAHETDAGPDVVGECLEESSQALLGALMRHPEQSLATGNLVDEREIGTAAAPLDLPHADPLDAREIRVSQSPQDRIFYRAKHVIPACVEGHCHIHPRQSLRPAGQEPAIAFREVVLALDPGHSLDDNPIRWARNPPHRVQEEDRHASKQHEIESSGSKHAVARTHLTAARPDRPAVGRWLAAHFDGLLQPNYFDEPLRLIDEGHERLDVIENTLEVHSAVAPHGTRSEQSHLLMKSAAGCSSPSWSARRAVPPSRSKPPKAFAALTPHVVVGRSKAALLTVLTKEPTPSCCQSPATPGKCGRPTRSSQILS
jgi:hypothetical protein